MLLHTPWWHDNCPVVTRLPVETSTKISSISGEAWKQIGKLLCYQVADKRWATVRIYANKRLSAWLEARVTKIQPADILGVGLKVGVDMASIYTIVCGDLTEVPPVETTTILFMPRCC